MAFQVLVLRRAEEDMRAAADWIAQHSAQSADRWFNGLVDALSSLADNPERCGFAPENESSNYQLWQLIYRPRTGRTFRAIFVVVGNQVRVLRIRGAGQDLLAPDELPG